MLGTYDIAIQVSELCFATQDGVTVFEDLSFTLLREEIKFVMGPPLSGKTLLLKLIMREVEPTRGQILVAGKNILRLSPRKLYSLRKAIGFVPYPPVILPERTVAGNLWFKLRALGIKGEVAEEGFEKALSLTGISEFKDVPAKELNPLEKRLLALAIAICSDPAVVLCDEIFRDLPESSHRHLIDSIKEIRNGGIAFLITTSDPSLPSRLGVNGSKVVELRPGVMT